jgi:hypothetical protein
MFALLEDLQAHGSFGHRSGGVERGAPGREAIATTVPANHPVP